MRLTGAQLGTLRDLVVKTWTRSELRILVRIKLERALGGDVNTDDGWKVVVFDFIDALNRDETVPVFTQVLREDKPNFDDLRSFCENLVTGEPGQPAPDAGELRRAIGAFNEQFNDDLFKYLNAYKELHDVLHELQSFLRKVADAVEARVAAPASPLAEDVDYALREYLARAELNAPDIEVPESPPRWIARLKAAVCEFTAEPADPGRMSSQLKRLKLLPAEGLAPLNEMLFAIAKRLKPRNLIDALDQILASLGDDKAPARKQLRTDAQAFRTLCADLDHLSTAHNLCQTIDDALREANGLAAVTAAGLSDWKEAREALDELVEQKSADDLMVLRVRRTADAARLFESANQAEAFQTFSARFDDLFLKTDKALLRVTNSLTRQAIALQKALKALEKAR